MYMVSMLWGEPPLRTGERALVEDRGRSAGRPPRQQRPFCGTGVLCGLSYLKWESSWPRSVSSRELGLGSASCGALRLGTWPLALESSFSVFTLKSNHIKRTTVRSVADSLAREQSKPPFSSLLLSSPLFILFYPFLKMSAFELELLFKRNYVSDECFINFLFVIFIHFAPLASQPN